MIVSEKNKDLLVAVFCYQGDRRQVDELMPFFEHHKAPIVIVSPDDSKVTKVGPHICVRAGKKGYIGQHTWDRQRDQMEQLLQFPQQWFLLNDADSFCVTPEIPSSLFRDDNTVYSNQVDDFRKPGESWQGMPPWPKDYHKGYPLIAMQPPYFLHRNAMKKIVDKATGLVACPICPFIDWWWIPAVYAAHVKHARFPLCASCETSTPNGKAVMNQCVKERQAQFIHSVKDGQTARNIYNLYHSTWK